MIRLSCPECGKNAIRTNTVLISRCLTCGYKSKREDFIFKTTK